MTLPALTPPPLNSPSVIDLPATGYADTDNITVSLDPGEDAVIRFPRTRRVGHVSIHGGRNVAINGGYQTIGKNRDGTYPSSGFRGVGDYNIEVRDGDDGRIVWIAGMLIDASGGAQSDGFFVNAPNSIVQLYKCRVEALLGSLHHGRHADAVQTPGGCRRLQFDHVTAASHYNTLYLRRENSPLMPPVEELTIRYSNTFGYQTNPAASGDDPTYTLRGISLGTQPADDDCNQYGQCGPSNDLSATNGELATLVRFDNFHIDAASAGRDPLQWVFPDAGQRTYAAAHPVLDGFGGLYWPAWRSSGQVRGRVLIDPPRYGDYAKARDVGVDYAAGVWAA